MKVFYTASYYGKTKYQEYYDLVLKTIKQAGCELLSPEIGNYLAVLKLEDYTKPKSKIKLHYEAVHRGINWAQAVIIEISHEDFQLGHDVSLAIKNKKPVLCLSIHEDFSKKISSPFFFGAKYNEHNIKKIVGNFIGKTKKETLNERFNLFLSRRQITNMEEASKKLGMNNSEYLRMLIDKSN